MTARRMLTIPAVTFLALTAAWNVAERLWWRHRTHNLGRTVTP